MALLVLSSGTSSGYLLHSFGDFILIGDTGMNKNSMDFGHYKVMPQRISLILREGFTKNKLAVLLDFVQMRGGRAMPKYFVPFA